MTPEFIVNHLWQSSCFALLASVLAFLLRGNSPKVRYCIWLCASMKFLVPWALLVSLGSLTPWPRHRVASVVTSLPDTLVRIVEPFSPNPYPTVPRSAQIDWGITVLDFLWGVGFIAIAFTRCRSWCRVRAMLRAATPVKLPIAVPALIAPGAHEPGVIGFLRPVLVLPALLLARLDPKQLEALLAHEMSHVRRHDNFFAALHMGVETMFWFHPLVWWLGSRMLEERELACDEEVLRRGCEPTDYVRSILTVCEHYSEVPLLCVSGVTGADIKKRLKTILRGTVSPKLNQQQKLALVFAVVAAIAVPVGLGLGGERAAYTRSTKRLKFEVASVKPADPNAKTNSSSRDAGEGLDIRNVPVRNLITLAYGLLDFQLLNAPGWTNTEGYDVVAKAPTEISSPSAGPQNPPESLDQRRLRFDRVRERLRSLLAERFGLVVHYETREHSVYFLTVAKSGPKLRQIVTADGPPHNEEGRGHSRGFAVPIEMLVTTLSNATHTMVFDKTGFTGRYDYTLKWTPELQGAPANPDADPVQAPGSGPTIYTAVREQLGLQLVSGKAPVDLVVVDHVDRRRTPVRVQREMDKLPAAKGGVE
jgi:bla regulator protein BlaR1